MRLGECVSAALAGAAEQGSWIVAKAALKPLDPLVRALARRRLERVLLQARRLTTLDEPAHVLRVAALLALGPPPAELDLDDVSGVTQALSAQGARAVPRQRPWRTLAAALALLCVVALGLFIPRLFAPFDARETPAGKVLGHGLTTFIRALASANDVRLEEARALAAGAPARRAFGEQGAERLERVLETAERAARATSEGTGEKHAFLGATDAFSKFLRDAGLPYYVDADVLDSATGPMPALLSSYVEREIEIEGAGQRVPALHLWRLDRLGIFGVLGYTRPRTEAALVLLDPIETDLVRWVLPALPPGERVEMVDEDSASENWAIEVEREAAAIIRRHYAPLLDANVTRVGRILARRRALIEKWRGTLESQGRKLRVPDRLIPEADYARDLEIRITRPNLREWDEIHEELLSQPVLAAFGKLRDRYTLSIERHEVQHRLDFLRGFVPLPDLAARLAGVEDPLDLPEGSLGATVRNEFSAYLAQLAQGADSPLLDLVLMARLSLHRSTVGGAHSRAAVATLLAVGAELGIAAEPYLAGGMTRREIAELLLLVAKKPPVAIRDAATRAYANHFGTPLASIRRREVRTATPWRH